MKLDEKQRVMVSTAIIASFILGSIVTTTITSKTPASPSYTQASIWSRLFGNVQQSEITEYADVIRLVLDQVEKIHELETRITVLETCGGECEGSFPTPDYDSGWQPITQDQTLTLEHNLDTMNYLVYLIHSDSEKRNEFHNFASGGAFFVDTVTDVNYAWGTRWQASRNSIDVHRYLNDGQCDYIRVILWKIPS